MIRGLVFIALLLLASILATGYLAQTPDDVVEEVVQTITLEEESSFEYPIEDFILEPFVRPDYISNKTWGMTVLECKVYASDENRDLIGIEIDDIESPEIFDHKCLLLKE